MTNPTQGMPIIQVDELPKCNECEREFPGDEAPAFWFTALRQEEEPTLEAMTANALKQAPKKFLCEYHFALRGSLIGGKLELRHETKDRFRTGRPKHLSL